MSVLDKFSELEERLKMSTVKESDIQDNEEVSLESMSVKEQPSNLSISHEFLGVVYKERVNVFKSNYFIIVGELNGLVKSIQIEASPFRVGKISSAIWTTSTSSINDLEYIGNVSIVDILEIIKDSKLEVPEEDKILIEGRDLRDRSVIDISEMGCVYQQDGDYYIMVGVYADRIFSIKCKFNPMLVPLVDIQINENFYPRSKKFFTNCVGKLTLQRIKELVYSPDFCVGVEMQNCVEIIHTIVNLRSSSLLRITGDVYSVENDVYVYYEDKLKGVKWIQIKNVYAKELLVHKTLNELKEELYTEMMRVGKDICIVNHNEREILLHRLDFVFTKTEVEAVIDTIECKTKECLSTKQNEAFSDSILCGGIVSLRLENNTRKLEYWVANNEIIVDIGEKIEVLLESGNKKLCGTLTEIENGYIVMTTLEGIQERVRYEQIDGLAKINVVTQVDSVETVIDNTIKKLLLFTSDEIELLKSKNIIRGESLYQYLLDQGVGRDIINKVFYG